MRKQLLTGAVMAVAAALGACGGGSTGGTPPVEPTDDMTATNSPKPPDDLVSAPVRPKRPWPDTRREAIVDKLHGVDVADPYRWLEDEKKPEVQAWMDAQDDYARAELAKLPGRDAMAARLKELFYFDSIGAPQHRKGRFFYTRKHADKEKTIVYWKQGEKGAEKVLFDPNAWSADGTKGLGGWWPSEDGKLVAYNVKENNADEAVLHVIDVATGKDLADVIPGTKYTNSSQVAWTPDSKGFYYTWIPEPGVVPVADRPGFAEVRFHELGGDPAKDEIVHEKTGNAQTFIGGDLSKDGHWLSVTIAHGWNSTDVYYKDLRPKAKNKEWQTLVAGVDALFDLKIWRDKFYVFTNDGAPKYRLFRVDPAKPARADWTEIVAEQKDATLEGVSIVGERLVLTYLRNAASEIEVHGLDGRLVRKVELPPLGTSQGIAGNPDEDTGYFGYTSFTEPSVIYKTSIKSGKVSEWARVKLPVDTSKFETEQVWYTSKDGTKVSMFIVHPKGIAKDGTHPTVLYGYGGFNVSLTPGWSGSRAAWIEAGGIWAVPNLRGGGEYGEDWHRDGMLLKKQNVFDDYIAAGKFLVSEGWTKPEHLAVYGGSNGGLLVGAALTQAPEQFGAVVCAVPLLDMVRYHLFGSGKTWVPEYGSAEDPDQFKALYAYSPYHRVTDGTRYPPLLMLSADHDDRVDPMHARKLTAQVQYATGGDAPVLLRIEKNAGHGGADLVKQQVEQGADTYAFLLSVLK
jgi:prolyl oligopeptidase